jgi:DNA-binding transcriptional ArsR family regulator
VRAAGVLAERMSGVRPARCCFVPGGSSRRGVPRCGAFAGSVGRVLWSSRICSREVKDILQFVDRTPAPSLLPILRSQQQQQQGEILALLLGDPDLDLSLTEIARLTGVPHPSVFREVERAERAGLVTSRKVGNNRLVRVHPVQCEHPGSTGIGLWRAAPLCRPSLPLTRCGRKRASPSRA